MAITPDTTTTTPHPEVPLPAGALEADSWQALDRQPYRVVFGAYRDVTDHAAGVPTSVIQWADGHLDHGEIEAPSLVILGGGEGESFNSDQARELAAALLEAAAEVDGWAGR